MTINHKQINNRVFAILGIPFIVIGMVVMLMVNTVVGAALLAAGLGNTAVGLSRKTRN